MRTALALTLAAALVGDALAQPGQPTPPTPPAPQPAAQPAAKTPPRTAGQPPTTPPATPPAPGQPAGSFQVPQVQPIPVPDGPVVKTTQLDGGLILEDIKIGEGYEVKPGGVVVAHYHGTLKTDPTKIFDSSFNRGEPAMFPLTGVIAGWGQGVPGMKIGGVRRLIIPSALAYAERSPSPEIPANSDLVFVIQLVDALQIEDLKVGEGEAASGAAVAVTTFTMTDQEGKEVEKAEAAKPYIWLPGEFQPVNFGLEGMKVGGKRKLVIPKQMNRPNPNLQSTRPADVPLTIELDLVAVRNLPGQQQRRR